MVYYFSLYCILKAFYMAEVQQWNSVPLSEPHPHPKRWPETGTTVYSYSFCNEWIQANLIKGCAMQPKEIVLEHTVVIQQAFQNTIWLEGAYGRRTASLLLLPAQTADGRSVHQWTVLKQENEWMLKMCGPGTSD